MELGCKTPQEQSPVKDCPPAPVKKERSSSYVVFDGNTGNSHRPMSLGTFMGALESYHRGLDLDDEEKDCLRNAGYKI